MCSYTETEPRPTCITIIILKAKQVVHYCFLKLNKCEFSKYTFVLTIINFYFVIDSKTPLLMWLLVEYRSVVREAVVRFPAGPTLRVLK
jgi:hypothetical protein